MPAAVTALTVPSGGVEDGEAPAESTAAPSPLRAFAATVAFIVAFALRIVLRFTGDSDDEPERPYVPPDPAVLVAGLGPGVCLREPYPAFLVHPVPCTDPHGSEIVALLTHPAPPGAPYPAVLGLFQQTLDPCRRAFEAYAGRPAGQVGARVFVVPPLTYQWAGGDRTVVCFAEAGDGTPRTSSLRAS